MVLRQVERQPRIVNRGKLVKKKVWTIYLKEYKYLKIAHSDTALIHTYLFII